ncbi:DegT/DnrJ/EryC1/StrS family aminotransferase [Methanobacterium petrolearium]|uniref:DegT/DnrJ/EryC1/StrS family aminotransferase n=1 Tax=Methanobacterium petrolearium TaxID=710190 RepID=UPI001AE163BC|nr:DegT/DnrJ/EryC1/StrS family aminotransferase [Methanobacterium petrolearium]MBP1945341.1 perosamine synthetase [Methanobacterium petrolearium]
MTWKIPLFKILWDEDDVEAVDQEIKSGMNWAVGENVEKFETLLNEEMGSKYSIAFNSGTSAIHALLYAHGIGSGDEVIVPSFTFIATANAPFFVGAKPMFADIEEETLGLDPESVNEMITPKTRAIMPIHYGGCPCKIRELRELADDNDLILIEDAAEAMGAKIKDKMVGTFGDSAILSFCQNKIITTGEGGAVLTDSREIYEKLLLTRSHGRLETEDYFSSLEPFDYVTLGYNFRMSNITAALGISQLKKLEKIIAMRRKNSQYYNKKLEPLNNHIRPLVTPKDYYNVYQLYNTFVEKRDELMRYLGDKGIMSKIYFDPVHLSYFYKNKLNYKCDLPVTEKISKKILTLPMYPGLKEEEIDLVANEIANFYE